MNHAPISHPAPTRERFNTPNGYATRPYEMEAVLGVIACGGWFRKGTDFANKQVAGVAKAR